MHFDIDNDRHKIYFAKEMTNESTDKDTVVESIDNKSICITDIDDNHHVSYSYSTKCLKIEMDIYNRIFNELNSNKLNNKRVAFVLNFDSDNLDIDFYESIFEMVNSFGYSIDVVSNNNAIHFIDRLKRFDMDLFFDIDNVIDNEKDIIDRIGCVFDKSRANDICFSLRKYLESNTPSLIISDNYYGLKSINSIKANDIRKLIYIPKNYKWNINDILNNSYTDNGTSEFLELIKESDDSIDIGVCSKNIKDIISRYVDGKNVFILDSPDVEIKDIVNSSENNKQGILCIGDHDEKSNHNELIKIASPTGIPITFVCNNPKEKVNGDSLEDLIVKNCISAYSIINGDIMNCLEIIIKTHRAVIDLSNNTNEYFIKTALELGSNCIINNLSELQLDGVERMNTEEMIQSIKTLIKAYGNPYNVIDLDFDDESINKKIVKDWRSYVRN